eukprot:2730542-Amphidinium_carterae.3
MRGCSVKAKSAAKMLIMPSSNGTFLVMFTCRAQCSIKVCCSGGCDDTAKGGPLTDTFDASAMKRFLISSSANF